MSEPSGSCPKIFLYVQPRLSSGSLRRAALRTVRAPMPHGAWHAVTDHAAAGLDS